MKDSTAVEEATVDKPEQPKADSHVCDICEGLYRQYEFAKFCGVVDGETYDYEDRSVLSGSVRNNICHGCAEELFADADGVEVGE